MQFTAMLRYDPTDPFSARLSVQLYRAGIEIEGIPTVIQGGLMQHVYCTSVLPLSEILRTLSTLGDDILCVDIGER